MKNSSHTQVIRMEETKNPTITKTQIYLAVAFIYLYFITAIFL